MSKRLLVVATSDFQPDEIRSPIDDRFGRGTEVQLLWQAAKTDDDRTYEIADLADRIHADAVVVVTRISDERSWREAGAVESARNRIGVPVTHLLVA
jgi:hypothetical protein